MNASNNSCKFVGRLTKSPLESLKKLVNGNYFLSISLAVKSPAIDKDGVAYERTSYPQLTIWNENALAIAMEFTTKGDLVEVTAQVHTRRFLADDRKTWRYVTEFLVDSIKPITSAELQSQDSVVADSEPATAPTKAPNAKPKAATVSSKSAKARRAKAG